MGGPVANTSRVTGPWHNVSGSVDWKGLTWTVTPVSGKGDHGTISTTWSEGGVLGDTSVTMELNFDGGTYYDTDIVVEGSFSIEGIPEEASLSFSGELTRIDIPGSLSESYETDQLTTQLPLDLGLLDVSAERAQEIGDAAHSIAAAIDVVETEATQATGETYSELLDLFGIERSGTIEFRQAINKDLKDDAAFKKPIKSPLVIDMDGDGVELISLADSNAFFDLNIDGFAELTGWVNPWSSPTEVVLRYV